ncbi:hypothetical protein EYF80_019422 [Liparis tanakae]|uniref:Uncharacterized protein n=1 Tax=Liparis tanakae TaxID=230148 RepID=A0A4Z2HX10_9TELE|nr:hypothetical protein EYF80_019422 [Liparis tanakae]
MSTVFSFQTQLVSIMDALSKTAAMEISKLVEIESKMLKIEITRGRNEIVSLTEKLQLMEKLLYIAQGGRQQDAACSVGRDASEDASLEPDRTGPHAMKGLSFEMMCDTTNRSFRAQLAAVLDKLTKAALVEIGNLADECSSVLHTEITHHKTENETLKRRCYLLEVQLRAAKEAQTYSAHVNSLNRRHSAEPQQSAPAIEGVFGKDWCMDLWRDDKLPPQRKAAVEPPAMTSMGAQAIDLLESEPDLIFVKEEIYDDYPIGQQMRLTDNRKARAELATRSCDKLSRSSATSSSTSSQTRLRADLAMVSMTIVSCACKERRLAITAASRQERLQPIWNGTRGGEDLRSHHRRSQFERTLLVERGPK